MFFLHFFTSLNEIALYKVTSIGTKLKYLIGVNYDRRNFKKAQRTFR